MKSIIFTFFTILVITPAFAGNKNKLAIGGSFLKDIYPASWHSDQVIKKNAYFGPFTSAELWIAYYIENKYSVRVNFSYMFLSGNPISNRPDGGFDPMIVGRMGTFHDVLIGKNLVSKIMSGRSAAWLYVGGGAATRLEQTSGGAGGGELVADEHNHYSHVRFYPTVQAMYKYNVLPFAFVAAGFTYRYLYSDFQQMSYGLSVGFQF